MSYDIPDSSPTQACFLISWPFGYDYVLVNIGGAFGCELSRDRSDATVSFALNVMMKQVDSSVRKHFIKGFATDWATNPLNHGAHAAIRPGTHGVHKKLARPVAEKLFFAGEAMGRSRSALVDGALNSGRKEAKKMIKALKV
ncbi:FAD-dependent oxidoreductase [Sulfitobacter sp. JB4-11]|uniref:FAD-dependent oxidoreductase n=1 Tax=Sulfitobacter rhodophyticola TaxID=3238304 RepID=UPI003518AC6C